MNRFGLALSRGGFRGVRSQLGPNRFLPDAGIAPQVSHISSVSGGRIIAAHPVLSCNRHIGSLDEFDAAGERSGFVRFDARDRMFRRFPLRVPVYGLRCLWRHSRKAGMVLRAVRVTGRGTSRRGPSGRPIGHPACRPVRSCRFPFIRG
jgi:hypothetical protein